MRSLTFVKRLVSTGNSLSINMTKEAKALGIKPGEYFQITICRMEEEE